MSEWVSVLAVFWVLWALDGVRLAPRRLFTVVVGGAGGARVRYSRLSVPGIWPTSWRLPVADVPVAVSPVGICNSSVGAAGRPAETSPPARTWDWAEVREVGVSRGWIFINGERFCADTGHFPAPQLLAMAGLEEEERARRLDALIRRSLRTADLRRRARLLGWRTRWVARINALTLVALIGLTLYVVGDGASRLPAPWSEALANGVPWALLGLLGLHVAAVVLAWRTKRYFRSIGPDKRGAALFSALLLPAQGLRLRSLLTEGIFPAQHPLAAIMAFGDRKCREEYVFNSLADLNWPVAGSTEPRAQEIMAWNRARLEGHLRAKLAAENISAEAIITPPIPDSPASRSYCPRCRDQFVEEGGVCPNGIRLRSLEASERAITPQSGTLPS